MEFQELAKSVLAGDETRTTSLCEQLLAEGETPERILNEGLVGGLTLAGEGMETGELYLAEVIIAAETFKNGFAVLEPHFKGEPDSALGRVAIGTIFGDIHDIGKDLVIMMLRAYGFEVYDLGIDVSADRFVEAAKAHQLDIVGISAELTTTMMGMKDVVKAMEDNGLRQKVKIMVGGPSVTEAFARSIGADGYGKDCFEAVVLAKKLMGI
ncbi:MAG TPA: cobalamin-binding protein [Dehalococcoidia bacterium]|nr:cobalamin-binding protein [Dehalococcoidia bacterium]